MTESPKIASLGSITEEKVDQASPKGEGDFVYVDIGSVDNSQKRIVSPKILPKVQAPSRAKQQLKSGDVLVSMTRPNLNAVAIVPDNLDAAIGSTGFHVLRASGCAQQWLYYAVQTNHFIESMCQVVQGALYPAVRPKDIRSYEIPVPDISEQYSIAAHIDTQFSLLDAGIAALKRAQANLKRYRASVLKAACEGRLVPTEAVLARKDGRAFETGDVFLAKLLETRRQSWAGRGLYREPMPPKLLDLPSPIEGWAWATAEQLSDANRAVTYGVIKLGDPVEGGVPVLRSSDVRALRLELNHVKQISSKIADNYRRTYLMGQEILVTVRGTLGGVVVAPAECAGYNISREVAMLALVKPELANAASIFIAAEPTQRWLLLRAKGIAYTGINIETLKRLPIPVPPLAEQERIVAEVERRLSVADSLEATLTAQLTRSTRLRQSILHKALGGPS